jgi:aryl-alcohol dehydrogenase-like predicted oxidoreductase
MSESRAGVWRIGNKSVNRIGFGAMRLTGRVPFGEGSPHDYQQAIEVLRRAVDLGVNHFDTAAFYRSQLHGANELLKAALWPYRDELLIATKVRSDLQLEGQSLRSQVEENLRELGLETLDLVYLRARQGTSILNDFVALSELKDAGLIERLGLSGVDERQIDETAGICEVEAIQNRYGIGVRRDDAVLHAAAARNIAFVPFFSIAAEGRHHGPPIEDREEVRHVAKNHGVSVAMVRIAWTLSLGPNVLAIPGTGRVDHLDENLEAGALRLSAKEMESLTEVTPISS